MLQDLSCMLFISSAFLILARYKHVWHAWLKFDRDMTVEASPDRRLKDGIRRQGRAERRHLSWVGVELDDLPRLRVRRPVIGDDSCAGQKPKRRRHGCARCDFGVI